MNTFQRFTYRGLAMVSLASAMVLGTTSCSLDRDPPLNELTTVQVYKDPANYPKLLAKLYAGLVLTGMGPKDGFEPRDISLSDGGATSFSRALWKMQELTADHAAVAWPDPGLPDLNTTTLTTANTFVQAMYVRIFFEIGLCNEYLRNTTDEKLTEFGISGANADRAREYRNDARFLRALSYYYAIDMFGNVPFVTENDPVAYFLPKQISTDFQAGRTGLFNYVESELKAIEASAPPAPQYGRMGQAAVQTLLAHLYLNAETWTLTPRYTEAATYAKRVIDNGLGADNDGRLALCEQPGAEMSAYQTLFATDNGQNPATRREIIFPIACDGLRSQSYGGTTFLVNASTGGPFSGRLKGVGGWGGIRAKLQLPLLFADTITLAAGVGPDKRGEFYQGTGPTAATFRVGALNQFRNGVGVWKWTNLASTSTTAMPVRGSDPGNTFPDTDIPLFRLGEVYLTYAEAAMRGGGDQALALDLVNRLRRRAYGTPTNTPNASADLTSLTLDQLLDERGRETYWECYRRTDLIRFGKFTGGTYNWTWKGNTELGRALPDHFRVFPLPASDLAVNPSLVQNPGY